MSRCAVDVAAVRADPSEDAEQVTQVLRGEPVTIVERAPGWARIRTAYDYPGWVRDDALEDGDGELPPRRDGAPVDEAHTYAGAPYLWGGMTERGIDCSGLVHMSYRRLGRLVPRDADQQEEAAEKVSDEELRPGDLITYGDGETATHIAFWLGDGRILHSTDRADAKGVLAEEEPAELRRIRRFLLRL